MISLQHQPLMGWLILVCGVLLVTPWTVHPVSWSCVIRRGGTVWSALPALTVYFRYEFRQRRLHPLKYLVVLSYVQVGELFASFRAQLMKDWPPASRGSEAAMWRYSSGPLLKEFFLFFQAVCLYISPHFYRLFCLSFFCSLPRWTAWIKMSFFEQSFSLLETRIQR